MGIVLNVVLRSVKYCSACIKCCAAAKVIQCSVIEIALEINIAFN